MTHRVLILCTGNCVRGQMAEDLLRQLGGSAFEVHSAGSKPNGYVSELAIEAMRAIGLDISARRMRPAALAEWPEEFRLAGGMTPLARLFLDLSDKRTDEMPEGPSGLANGSELYGRAAPARTARR